jgi:hypothetical protein
MSPRRAVLASITLLACLGVARAAEEISVTASVDAERIGENESITLTVEIRGTNLPAIEEPDLAGLADFSIASGPNLSSSTSMVWSGGGARMTSVRRYSYVLLPKRRGSLKIPSLELLVGPDRRRTREIAVEVVEGGARGGRGAPRTPRGGGGGSSGLLGERRGSAGSEPEVYVEAALDRKQIYVGEQVLLTYRLYSQAELAALPQPRELPAFTGFWVEEIAFDPRATLRRTVIRGREYNELLLMKKALFPTRSGELVVEETLFEIPVRLSSKDPFDAFFNRSRPLYRRAPELILNVKPLPDAGRPASFRGGVGQFSMKVEMDRTDAMVNDAVGLSVKVEGDGNLRAVGEPVLPDLPDFRRYDPKVEEEQQVVGDRIKGARTWSYVMVPLTPGQSRIPPVRFSYFDPSTASYQELTGPAMSLKIASAPGGMPGAEGGAVRRDVVAMRRDIRYIKPASSLDSGGDWMRHSPWFFVLIAAPVVGNIALYARLRHGEHLAANVDLLRRRQASRAARKRLRSARQLAQKGAAAAFYAEMDRAITGFLADKFNVAAAGLTRDRIDELLDSGRVDPEIRTRTLGCLEQCDFGRFAPAAAGKEKLRSVLARGEDAISRLERTLG